MSRRLSLAVSLILPLLAAHVAAAAGVCDPGSPAAAAPDAPFQADAPGALGAEERARLLSLDGGRYEERDGFLADRRAASPGSAVSPPPDSSAASSSPMPKEGSSAAGASPPARSIT